jgi:hypothetical protein
MFAEINCTTRKVVEEAGTHRMRRREKRESFAIQLDGLVNILCSPG